MTHTSFAIGCNYWASHAGTAMWRDFRADIVEQDFRQLTQAGINTVRLFPLWSDFQPLHLLRKYAGTPTEYRHGETPLPNDELGQAGIDPVMFERFQKVADLAKANKLQLIVGLVTGWMSGRFFAPPGLEHLDAIRDPESIKWQVRFVRAFVKAFKNHPAIYGWDLGNECNCMGKAATASEAWLWTNAITSAIRLEDPSRPVVSGMHSLSASPAGPWTIHDQGELTDLLCTHPYPAFTPGCDLDPLPTFRPAHHAAAESVLYADISGKPCLVEEIGTLGDEFGNEQTAAQYVHLSIATSWVYNTAGFLWWCGFDQKHLEHAPYDWCGVERELGLIRADRTPKPVLAELSRFERFLDALPFKELPPRHTDAVCILSNDQDNWKVAYSSFLLARQAAMDIRFAWHGQPIPEAPIYMLPCYSGLGPISRRTWLDLQERVKKGATLYLSHNDGLLSFFRETTGMEVVTRSRNSRPTTFTLPDVNEPVSLFAPIRLHLQSAGAEVLVSDSQGDPVLTSYKLGKGQVIFLSVPLEMHVANTPGSLSGTPWWTIYRRVLSTQHTGRAIVECSPWVGVTEHLVSSEKRIIVEINYAADDLPVELPTEGWTIAQWHTAECTYLKSGDVCVFEVQKAARRTAPSPKPQKKPQGKVKL